MKKVLYRARWRPFGNRCTSRRGALERGGSQFKVRVHGRLAKIFAKWRTAVVAMCSAATGTSCTRLDIKELDVRIRKTPAACEEGPGSTDCLLSRAGSIAARAASKRNRLRGGASAVALGQNNVGWRIDLDRLPPTCATKLAGLLRQRRHQFFGSRAVYRRLSLATASRTEPLARRDVPALARNSLRT